jgi:hypothetical protein
MQARNVSLGAMFAWIPATFRWFERGSVTLMGASAVMLVASLALSVPMYAVMFATTGWHPLSGTAQPLAGQPTLFWIVYGLSIVVSMLVYPPMVSGWFRLARDIDVGAPVAATQILQPYRDPVTWMRSLVFVGLAFLVFLLVFGVFAAAFYQPAIEFWAHAQAQQAAIAAGLPPPQTAFPFVLFAAYLLFVFTLGILQLAVLVGFAEVALRPTPALAALRLGLVGVLRNLPKLLVLLFVLFLAMLVVMLVVVLLLMIVVAVTSMISPKLAVVVMGLLYIPVLLVVYPLMFGGHYFIWKDMLGGAEPDTDMQA